MVPNLICSLRYLTARHRHTLTLAAAASSSSLAMRNTRAMRKHTLTRTHTAHTIDGGVDGPLAGLYASIAVAADPRHRPTHTLMHHTLFPTYGAIRRRPVAVSALASLPPRYPSTKACAENGFAALPPHCSSTSDFAQSGLAGHTAAAASHRRVVNVSACTHTPTHT